MNPFSSLAITCAICSVGLASWAGEFVIMAVVCGFVGIFTEISDRRKGIR